MASYPFFLGQLFLTVNEIDAMLNNNRDNFLNNTFVHVIRQGLYNQHKVSIIAKHKTFGVRRVTIYVKCDECDRLYRLETRRTNVFSTTPTFSIKGRTNRFCLCGKPSNFS